MFSYCPFPQLTFLKNLGSSVNHTTDKQSLKCITKQYLHAHWVFKKNYIDILTHQMHWIRQGDLGKRWFYKECCQAVTTWLESSMVKIIFVNMPLDKTLLFIFNSESNKLPESPDK